VLDATDVCAGCGRTIDEIAVWPAADVEMQRAIVARAAARLRAKEGRD
jgi:predicted Fe-S protein YdhL (DUF1289 family)